MQIVYSN